MLLIFSILDKILKIKSMFFNVNPAVAKRIILNSSQDALINIGKNYNEFLSNPANNGLNDNKKECIKNLLTFSRKVYIKKFK